MFIEKIAHEKALGDLTKKLKDFDKKLEDFSKNDAGNKRDAEIIQDPTWRDIAHDAKIILDTY